MLIYGGGIRVPTGDEPPLLKALPGSFFIEGNSVALQTDANAENPSKHVEGPLLASCDTEHNLNVIL